MKRLLLMAIAIILIFNTAEARAQEARVGSAGAIGFLAELVGAVYTSTAIHESGHYNEAESLGLSPNISLGLIKSEANDGSSSFYLGKTSYGEYPKDPETRSRLALAGMESTGNAYETLNEKIRNGEENSRFSSMVALLCKTDFPRYALMNGLKEEPDQLDDIESYTINSGANKEFTYGAALLDVLFNWDDIKFHTKRVLGKDPEVPKRKEIFGFEAKPKVFVQSDAGVVVGFGLRKRW